ncbi:MAG: iron-regulated protein frpC, partial [Rhodobacteraceae bacterium]|nr:iron-regulated protein frpC [Paracoccaceae bacterium]
EIKLDLDGGDGIDTLDFSEASAGVDVNLAGGTAGSAHVENFENVIGSAFDDRIVGDEGNNVIRGGGGNDFLAGGGGADVFVFAEADVGVTVIADFDFELDSLLFVTDKNLTGTDIVDSLVQDGDDVTFEISDKQITIENALVESFSADDFVIA